MRRLKCIAVVLMIITLSVCVSFSVRGISGQQTAVYYDDSDIYFCEADGNTVKVRSIIGSSEYKYTFDNLLSFCVAGDKLYATVNTDQQGVFSVQIAAKGKIVGSRIIKSKSIPVNTAMCADSSGRLYYVSSGGAVGVFGSDGKSLGKTGNNYYLLFHSGKAVYAASLYGIYKLNGASETKVSDSVITDNAFSASKNFAANSLGYVYDLKTGSRMSVGGGRSRYSICVSSNYIVGLSGNTISLYNKSSGALVNSSALSYSPDYICASGSKIYAVKKSSGTFTVNVYKERNFLPKASTISDSKTAVSTGINFGKYKLSGSYVFVPLNTSRGEFKSEVKYEGYDLKFSKTSGLGTGTKAVFTKGGKSYTYKTVAAGDLTGTGKISNRDVDIMFNCLFGLDKVSGVYKTAADMNGDGRISNVDLVMQDRKRN